MLLFDDNLGAKEWELEKNNRKSWPRSPLSNDRTTVRWKIDLLLIFQSITIPHTAQWSRLQFRGSEFSFPRYNFSLLGRRHKILREFRPEFWITLCFKLSERNPNNFQSHLVFIGRNSERSLMALSQNSWSRRLRLLFL